MVGNAGGGVADEDGRLEDDAGPDAAELVVPGVDAELPCEEDEETRELPMADEVAGAEDAAEVPPDPATLLLLPPPLLPVPGVAQNPSRHWYAPPNGAHSTLAMQRYRSLQATAMAQAAAVNERTAPR